MSLSEVLNDVIGRAVAHRKIGECYAEMGNINAALKVSSSACTFFFFFVAIEPIFESSTLEGRKHLKGFLFTCLLQHQHCHLDLARSVRDHAEEQRALATIGRTYLFRYESDQSRNTLEQAKDTFMKSLAIVNDRLEGVYGLALCIFRNLWKILLSFY